MIEKRGKVTGKVEKIPFLHKISKKKEGLRDMLKTCPFRPRLPHLGHFDFNLKKGRVARVTSPFLGDMFKREKSELYQKSFIILVS